MKVEIHDEFSMSKIAMAEILEVNAKPARPVVELKISEVFGTEFSTGETALFTLRKDGIFRQKGGSNVRIDAIEQDSENLLNEAREGKKVVSEIGKPIQEAKNDFENRNEASRFLYEHSYQYTSIKANTRYVAVDVETTGLYPDSGDKIIQYALLNVTDLVLKGKQENFEGVSSFVNPDRDIPIYATNIHGITDADVAHEETFSAHADKIAEFLDGAVLVGHNAEFDMKFINYQLMRSGKNPLKNPLVCTWKIAKDALLVEKGFVPNNKLKTLSAKFVNRETQRMIKSTFGGGDHDARYDALMSAILAYAFFEAGISKPQNTGFTKTIDENEAIANEENSPTWQKLAYVGLAVAGLFGIALMV